MAAINTTAANRNSSVTAAAIAPMTAVKSPRHASEGVGSPQSHRAPRAAEGSAWNQIVRGESEPIATVPSSTSAVTEQVVTPMKCLWHLLSSWPSFWDYGGEYLPRKSQCFQVNYLFDDCSETLFKVKQAFCSTAVDLPPEESTALYHYIILTETFDLDDFELPDNEFQGVPVGVRDFDIDGELWVKLRLIPNEPFVGAVSWAFVQLPKIKFELSPLRLFNFLDYTKIDPEALIQFNMCYKFGNAQL
ncbi:hypothetical protein F8388_004706 [Cannabis sativa]|uniref:Uncharacterized protein n=1 Tax=Cannabis sativa TaxID=3483 RepID=A0A7J6HPT4_CANSA|nr:hypothetical protein F8388_004706 [Cannabis sativa]